jgi:ribosomal-protein-alanine N-acetyltransferase
VIHIPYYNMERPFLIGEKCYLRSLTPEDAGEGYLQWFNDEETCRYNSHHRFPMAEESLRTYLRSVESSKTDLVLAVINKKTNAHVGNVALQNIDWISRSAELAVIIGEKDCRGKGIGREACALVIRHGFSELNLNRIWFGTMENNTGMRKVAEALGFVCEGVLRQANCKQGRFVDGVVYGLLRSEYGEPF